MLSLLLDEHISPAVAQGLHRRHPRLVVHPMRDWLDGKFLCQSDDLILQEAQRLGLTLVTYDQRTIRSLAMRWAHEDLPHSGIIFIDEKTIPPRNIGGLVRALSAVISQSQQHHWKNRIIFLQT